MQSESSRPACAIPLTKGYTAFVDAEDFERFGRLKWYARVGSGPNGQRQVYAARTVKTTAGKRMVYLHRAILDAPTSAKVDHRDGDRLNDRRDNLRLATQGQNLANARKPRDAMHSSLKGVTWDRAKQKWVAQIGFGGRGHFLGYHSSDVEAARAYDAAARRFWGEFARVNFPDQ